MQCAADMPVNRRTHLTLLVDGAGGKPGQAGYPAGVVTLVGNAYDLVTRADGKQDLGGAGKQRGNAHRSILPPRAALACAARSRAGGLLTFAWATQLLPPVARARRPEAACDCRGPCRR